MGLGRETAGFKNLGVLQASPVTLYIDKRKVILFHVDPFLHRAPQIKGVPGYSWEPSAKLRRFCGFRSITKSSTFFLTFRICVGCGMK